jgi:hypothetical protein
MTARREAVNQTGSRQRDFRQQKIRPPANAPDFTRRLILRLRIAYRRLPARVLNHDFC